MTVVGTDAAILERTEKAVTEYILPPALTGQ